MKKNTPIWIGVGIAVVVLLTLFIVKSCERGAKPEIAAIRDSVQFYKLDNGKLATALKQKTEDFSVLAARNANLLDSVAKLYKTKVSLLQEVAVLTQHGTVTIMSPSGSAILIYKTDTLWKQGDCPPLPASVAMEYRNPWYHVIDQISLRGDSSKIEIQTFDTLTYVAKAVKEGNLFNRKNYLQVVASNSNPYNAIVGLDVYRIPVPKPKKFGVGVQVGYGFSNALKPALYIGAGVSYNLIRF